MYAPRNIPKSPPPVQFKHRKESIHPTQAIELTGDQQDAYNKVIQFLKGRNKFFRLSGYAGTGKSYLIVLIRAC